MEPLVTRPAEIADVEALCKYMRATDRDEIKRSHGCDPVIAVLQTVAASDSVWTITNEKRPVVMFGVGSKGFGVGVPWMIATDEIDDIGRYVARETRRVVPLMERRYDVLLNYVDIHNDVSIRWLLWAGFELFGVEPFGVNGEPFYLFGKSNVR